MHPWKGREETEERSQRRGKVKRARRDRGVERRDAGQKREELGAPGRPAATRSPARCAQLRSAHSAPRPREQRRRAQVLQAGGTPRGSAPAAHAQPRTWRSPFSAGLLRGAIRVSTRIQREPGRAHGARAWYAGGKGEGGPCQGLRSAKELGRPAGLAATSCRCYFDKVA